jgi:DnaA-homolog protein
MFKQLPLSMPLSTEATFENFYISEANQLTISALQSFIQQDEHFFYLWGVGSGVSHVLQALQHASPQLNIVNFSLQEMLHFSAQDVLAGLDAVDVVILDDLQCISGVVEWEQAVFHLYNRLRDGQKKFIIGSQIAPRELDVSLADLHSRLQWGVSYSLESLSDEDKRRALILRSQNIGLRISDDVIQFVFNHYSRDLRQLMTLLHKIDSASLSEQRHITIPFVKQVLKV